MTTIDIFKAEDDFTEKALTIFRFQAEQNKVYRSYMNHLGIEATQVNTLEEIPFLPIELFKTKQVICEDFNVAKVFKSSGTGGYRSTHYVVDTAIYEASFMLNFENTYGSLDEICILALLPNYQDNPDSSLLYMMNELIERTASNGSTFLNPQDGKLREKLKEANKSQLKTILIGVSFALLDLVEDEKIDLSNLIVMETGGMKGRRKEITRAQLHEKLKSGLNQKDVHSEYGMCELLSQAYSKGKGLFRCPPWMKVHTRPLEEPFSPMKIDKLGVVKVIDLANIFSCSFIETQDLGIVHEDDSFEIMGRVDYAQIRGCNLMMI